MPWSERARMCRSTSRAILTTCGSSGAARPQRPRWCSSLSWSRAQASAPRRAVGAGQPYWHSFACWQTSGRSSYGAWSPLARKIREHLRPRGHCASGLSPRRTRLDASQRLSGARLQITRTRILWARLERGLGLRRSRSACSNGCRELWTALEAGLRRALYSARPPTRSLSDGTGQMAARHDRAARGVQLEAA
jgi:hypothetical protein